MKLKVAEMGLNLLLRVGLTLNLSQLQIVIFQRGKKYSRYLVMSNVSNLQHQLFYDCSLSYNIFLNLLYFCHSGEFYAVFMSHLLLFLISDFLINVEIIDKMCFRD